MAIFRIIVAALPQILALLLVGGWLDLLGGWNKTDSAFGILILLFLLTPIATLVLLVIEIIHYRKQARSVDGKRSFVMSGLAIGLFIESLALNIVILSQLRMH